MMHSSILVTYNPNVKELQILCESLLSQKSNVILIDNSEIPINEKDLMLSEPVKLISLKKNMGIAYAQNIGIKHSLKMNTKYISFFDQDSCIENCYISMMINEIESNGFKIVAPASKDNLTFEPLETIKLNNFGLRKKINYNKVDKPYSVDVVISSGTTILSEVINKVGMFDERFFIDYVDTEWCLRCTKNGIKIFVIPHINMLHCIGMARKKIGPYTIQVHSPIRCYYQIRNSILLLRLSHIPKIFAFYEISAQIFNRLLLLFIISNKKNYIIFYIQGVIDGILGKVGPK